MMNKKVFMIGLMSAVCLTIQAQNPYEAANFSTSDLNGTARYVGMGGALSALGGDISTMSTNPAGTGMFRKSEFSITASAVISGTSGVLGESTSKASFDQAGLVVALPTDDVNVQGMTFGLNINKHKNFFGNVDTDVYGLNGIFSQTNQIAGLANEALRNDNWQGALADMSAAMYSDKGELQKAGILNETYELGDDNVYHLACYEGVGAQAAHYQRSTWGSNMSVDMNFSINLKNQYFIGAAVSVYDVESRRNSMYEELGVDNSYFDFTNYYDTKGNGVSIKLGTIIRPIEESPFRFGVFIHTPTWYTLEDINGSELYLGDCFVSRKDFDPYQYRLRSPWRFGLSLGTTVGNYFAVGAEYEFQDLSTNHYSQRGGGNSSYFNYQNNMMNKVLKGQHTLKIGMEVKPADAFSIRCGYNFLSAPMKSDGYNILAYDGVMTETDFTNWKDTHRFTFGLGYRFKGGYIDMAYQYNTQKGDFYAFDDQMLPATEIKNNRSQIMATLGLRF